MDQTPVRYRSAMVPSIPIATHTSDASATYTSPVSATTSQGLRLSPIGLGISGCGLEPGFDNFRAFPGAVPCAASHGAPNQMILTEDFYDVDDFSSGPCFSAYNGVPPASNTPLSPYDSQTIGVSPSYNSSFGLDGLGNNAGQISAYWTLTPYSGPTTPLEDASATGHWNQPYFPEPCITVNTPTIPVGKGSHHPTTVTNGSTTLASHYNPEQTSSPRSATSTESFPPKSPQNVNENRNLSNHLDKDMEDGRKCPVCGYVFTRRSNCTEHQKRHDPTFKRTFNCCECKKTFGRNADLRRHIDNASQIRGPDKGYFLTWI